MIMKLDGDPEKVVTRTLCPEERLNVPKAPGLGLLLAQVGHGTGVWSTLEYKHVPAIHLFVDLF